MTRASDRAHEDGLQAIARSILVLAFQVGKLGSSSAALARIETKIDALLAGGGTPDDLSKLAALGKRIDDQTQELDDTIKSTPPNP